jgi:hypothetical protein
VDDLDEDSEFRGFADSNNSEDETPPEQPTARYVPPAAGELQANLSTREGDPRLRKQIQGTLNR